MIAYMFAVLLAGAGVFGADNCYNDVTLDCSQASTSLILPSCNAIFGGYGHHGNLATEMQAYANLHLKKSYEYLLSSAYYDNYQTNRAGFTKLFRKLSDHTWEKTIELIKHINLRGGVMDFQRRSVLETQPENNYTVELHELESLAKALDSEKELAERAFFIHREATRNSQHLHDAGILCTISGLYIAQYLEEEFIEYQSKNVRDLAGYTSDLKKFVTDNNGQDLSLALYIFDEYLKKVV
ncbi:Ferritin heavy chain [Eumeta japonica]|uniref:Ferritin n=1 Tax=Eumeta variegata TaxID=151549 RepID=A0A4C1V1N9_EUMVA|nr:Ferritin heavy chain [Eumeta japonica]